MRWKFGTVIVRHLLAQLPCLFFEMTGGESLQQNEDERAGRVDSFSMNQGRFSVVKPIFDENALNSPVKKTVKAHLLLFSVSPCNSPCSTSDHSPERCAGKLTNVP